LLFVSNRDGGTGVWAVPMKDGTADGDARLLMNSTIDMRPRGLTRSGALYFSATTSMQEIYLGSVDLASGKSDRAPAVMRSPTAGFNLGAAWSPDGKSLAYLPRKDASVIAIRSMETDTVREIHPDLAFIWAERPLWSPDGMSLVVVGPDRRGQWGLYRVDVRTGQTTMLIGTDDFARSPVHPVGWSSDGRLMYFRRRGEVSALDLQNGAQHVVEGTRGMFALSPDGRSWAWVDGPLPAHDPRPSDRTTEERSKSAVLYTMPVDGATPRELLRIAAPEDLRAPTWSPDGTHLLFFKLDTRDPFATVEVWAISAAGGAPYRTELDGHLPSLPFNDADLNKPIRVHPDGRTLAIETTKPEAEVWTMENVLRYAVSGRH
jgi:Tol biopolymer transport system component